MLPVISIAVFAPPEQRAVISQSFALREAALNIAYQIPGYRDLDLEDKNRVYDLVRDRLDIASQEDRVMSFRELLEEIAVDIVEASMQRIGDPRAAMLEEAKTMTDEELVAFITEV